MEVEGKSRDKESMYPNASSHPIRMPSWLLIPWVSYYFLERRGFGLYWILQTLIHIHTYTYIIYINTLIYYIRRKSNKISIFLIYLISPPPPPYLSWYTTKTVFLFPSCRCPSSHHLRLRTYPGCLNKTDRRDVFPRDQLCPNFRCSPHPMLPIHHHLPQIMCGDGDLSSTSSIMVSYRFAVYCPVLWSPL